MFSPQVNEFLFVLFVSTSEDLILFPKVFYLILKVLILFFVFKEFLFVLLFLLDQLFSLFLLLLELHGDLSPLLRLFLLFGLQVGIACSDHTLLHLLDELLQLSLLLLVLLEEMVDVLPLLRGISHRLLRSLRSKASFALRFLLITVTRFLLVCDALHAFATFRSGTRICVIEVLFDLITITLHFLSINQLDLLALLGKLVE